jgi:hypothetical protein
VDEYVAAERNYYQAHEEFQSVLDTWDRVEDMQIQDIHLLLEQETGMISQKAYGLINQSIDKTLQDWKLGGIQLEDVDLGHAKRGASGGKRGVRMSLYSTWTTYAE